MDILGILRRFGYRIRLKSGTHQVRTNSIPTPYQIRFYRHGDNTEMVRFWYAPDRCRIYRREICIPNGEESISECKSKNYHRKITHMEEEKYMRRCIQLAQNGFCNAAPNPMVGAVIVCDGKIIGEGYHVRCGEAHAEVNAIRSVKDTSLLKHSTIYVSLEPCSHHGKTPPCADLIIEKQIPRIVIGCQDPFSKVAGRGIQKLKDAGREVTVGVLENECRHLIRRFIAFHTLHRPYITLKWAESADGFIDLHRNGGSPVILSTPLTSMMVHKKRAEHAAILVGTRTAELDNPSLNVRNWYGRSPVRLVIDRKLSLSPTLHLFDGSVPTLVFTEHSHNPLPNVEYLPINFEQDILPPIMQVLYERNLQSLLIEGGSTLLQSFIDTNLWDEAFAEESPIHLISGVNAPKMNDKNSYVNEQYFGRSIRHYTATK